ncbi:MAG: ribose-phosphate pyrophosphokinae [Actinomycetota bacterium]|nr:ribose-phosphate pyrophosphokinae [Actinomycetota bacterium]
MELVTKKHLEIFSGRSHPELAQEIADNLGVSLSEPNLVDFASSEIRCRFGDSIRGADVFIIQSHAAPVNDSIMEQLIMIDAAKRASAKRITAVCPYYGYARQDRKAEGREPITAKLVTDMLTTAGADRIVAVDLHSNQIQGFFDGPFDHLTAVPSLIDHLRAHVSEDAVVVAADPGRIKVAERYGQHLDADVATIYKRRTKEKVNTVEALGIMGEVAGRQVVLVDEMIDSGGTICAAVEMLKDEGAEEIWVVATHGVLSGPAVDRLKNSSIAKLVLTNTLPIGSEKRFDKMEVLSVAPVIAAAIRAVFEDASVSELFGGENQI